MEGSEHGKELSRQRFVAGVVGILGSVISATIGSRPLGSWLRLDSRSLLRIPLGAAGPS